MDVDEYEAYERSGRRQPRVWSKADRDRLIRESSRSRSSSGGRINGGAYLARLLAKREVKRIQRSREESLRDLDV
eukprot:scaffold39829_cov206-Amphora_coffeaeformis.AAC.1